MQLHLILTDYNIPLWPPLKLVTNYGEFTIKHNGAKVEGTYVVIESGLDDFIKWAGLNPELWLGLAGCSIDNPIFERWIRTN